MSRIIPQELADRLEARAGSAVGQWTARCPAHHDRRPSLSIGTGDDGRVLLKCHKGCTVDDIVAALGLTLVDLMPEPEPGQHNGHNSRKPTAPRERRKTHRYPGVIAATGERVSEHVRVDRWDAGGRKLPKRMWWEPKGIKLAPLALYNAAALTQAKAEGRRITAIVTEGEHKCDALNRAIQAAGRDDLIAVGTMTGSATIPCDDSLRVLLDCADVWLWADNADDGRQHMARIGARLTALGLPSWQHIAWPKAPDKGDAEDYLAAGGTVDGIAAMLAPTSPPASPPAPASTAASAASAASAPTVRRWPKPLDPAAYYGVVGTIAREMEPYIEADSAALLVNLLTVAGVAIGRSPHVRVGAKRHYPCLYTVNVGVSGDNKGDAWWPIDAMLEQVTAKGTADDLPLKPTVWGGMSTGEGLLWQVRDERSELRDGELRVVDAGVKDKRLLAYEAEFARVLAVMYREGNTLSMVQRDLYDGANVARSSPKGNPITATGAHFGMIGQITPDELSRKLHEVELFNGFANRFLWVLTRRQHSRPNPPAYAEAKAIAHARLWSAAIAQARAIGEVTRDDEAAAAWVQVYEPLRTGAPDGKATTRTGMALEVCARAHVQVLRDALTFAALDGSEHITVAHQEAALAIWDYCEDCAMYLFGHVSGDPMAEVIADALVARGPLSRTDISRLFSRHTEAGAIQTVLDTLAAAGRARMWTEETSGRPRELWEATPRTQGAHGDGASS